MHTSRGCAVVAMNRALVAQPHPNPGLAKVPAKVDLDKSGIARFVMLPLQRHVGISPRYCYLRPFQEAAVR